MFDRSWLDACVAQTQPDVVLHPLTAFGATDGDPLQPSWRAAFEAL